MSINGEPSGFFTCCAVSDMPYVVEPSPDTHLVSTIITEVMRTMDASEIAQRRLMDQYMRDLTKHHMSVREVMDNLLTSCRHMIPSDGEVTVPKTNTHFQQPKRTTIHDGPAEVIHNAEVPIPLSDPDELRVIARASVGSAASSTEILPFPAYTSTIVSNNSEISAECARKRVAAEYQNRAAKYHRSGWIISRADTVFRRVAIRRWHCNRLLKFVQGSIFQFLVCFLILLNALFIAWRTQRAVNRSYEAPSDNFGVDVFDTLTFEAIEIGFNCIFALELALRIIAMEAAFCTGPEWRWNLLDTCLVLPSVVESMIITLDVNISFIRTLRLLRMLRTLRVVRIMRFAATFQHLRLMLLAVLNSLVPLFWAVFFLSFLMFIFAIIFMQGVAQYAADSNGDSETLADLKVFFYTLPMTLLTLLMSISGGLSWWDLARMLWDIGLTYVLFLTLYILIMLIVVLNIITGIFVTESIETASKDQDLLVHVELQRTQELLSELQRLFRDIDGDDTGFITLEQFEQAIQEDGVSVIFSLLDIDLTDARDFFKIIDVDRSNHVEIDEFVVGCLRLKGKGRSLVMEAVTQDNKQKLRGIGQQMKKLDHRLRDLCSDMHSLKTSLMLEKGGTDSIGCVSATAGSLRGSSSRKSH